MAESDGQKDAASRTRRTTRTGLLVGVGAMVLGAGAGFAAVRTGLILPDPTTHAKDAAAEAATGPEAPFADSGRGAEDAADVAFLPVDPLVVSLAGPAQGRHLRFRAELEVEAAAAAEVTELMPRVVDVMNGYLRAVDPAELEAQGALSALRAQLLRRVELVVGHGRVSDVLVMEFVLS